ncbi:hypothetical protein ACFPRL_26990 [Pseudoclavibacter helvolus]
MFAPFDSFSMIAAAIATSRPTATAALTIASAFCTPCAAIMSTALAM